MDKQTEFTIEDGRRIGAQFRAVCRATYNMEGVLTEGKVYLVTVTHRILPTSPLCVFQGDDGKIHEAHLDRFAKKQRS